MTEADRKAFFEMLSSSMETYGRTLTDGALGVWWGALESYPIEQIREGLSRHVAVSRFAPVPADVIQGLAHSDGRPGPDEAWALCPRSESDTSVWTEETADAYFRSALPLLEAADQIAARKAFLETYAVLVAEARMQRKPMRWIVSLGWDRDGREAALQNAVQLGRLTAPQIVPMLPYRAPHDMPEWLTKLIEPSPGLLR